MRLVQINVLCDSGSTGKICLAVSRMLTEKQVENYILYADGHSDYPLGRRYMSPLETRWQALRSRVLGNYGFNSHKATKRLLAQLEAIQPDVVHLHNLHGHNCHLGQLLAYLKSKHIKVYWTFHDCWAFTGYCPYYDMAGCDRWQRDCGHCPQRRRYSWFWDRSASLFQKKKAALSGLDLTVITPSRWLAEQVQASFLRGCDVRVIPNGIDLSVFQPRESDFCEKYRCQDKFVLLGVAFDWSARKGLDVFCDLAKRLDERFQIVLVGTNETVDKQLPPNILSIHHTQNQQELAAIYTAADLFVNPTREENYPTTHMEAIACGTPVLTFDTGGSGEMLGAACGAVVQKNDVDALENEILSIWETRPFSAETCVAHAKAFDQNKRFQEYVALYEDRP